MRISFTEENMRLLENATLKEINIPTTKADWVEKTNAAYPRIRRILHGPNGERYLIPLHYTIIPANMRVRRRGGL